NQQVVLQSELAAQAGAALQAVDAVTERIANAVKEINETATQQAEAAATISVSMSAIADITSQTRASPAQTQKTMDHLVEVAFSLLRSISAFKLGVSGKPLGPMLLPAADVITEPLAIATHPSGKLDPRRTKHLPTVDTMGSGRITHTLSPDAW